MRKKIFITISSLLSVTVCMARNDSAYEAGKAFGAVVGLILVAGFVIWGIRRINKKK